MLRRGDDLRRPGAKPVRPAVILAWLLGVTFVVLAGTQGTFAWWRSAIGVPSGQQVQAADFRVAMSNASGSSVEMPRSIDLTRGQSNQALFPGTSQFAEVTLRNRSTARAQAASVTVTLPSRPYAVDTASSAVRSFAGSLSLAVSMNVPVGTSCSAASGYVNVAMSSNGQAGQALSNSPRLNLAKDATAKVCFRATLDSNAPNQAQGRSAVITVDLQADQVPV